MRFLAVIAFLALTATTSLAVPPTPTNTPVAHPLAPNPHTSIGVFWIYTDVSTGRQWKGGTYKVRRCTGVACTPTTVVASGLTNADFQDTGLSTNTTYGYRYLANDGTDSADSPTVYVTTLAADSNMVQWPNATWEKLLGPQVEAAQIPFTWFNSVATTTGQTVISKYPVVAPFRLQGTGSIINGATTLTGSGTFFLEQVAANNPTCLDVISINGVNAGAIASVNSNTQITLATPWPGSTVSGVTLTTNVTGACGFNDPFGDYITGGHLMYYDSPFAFWQLYGRTGDPQYLRGAIQGSEAVFAGHLRLGRNRDWTDAGGSTDNPPAPRNFQFSGLVALGLAGHNGVWDLLDKYLTDRYQIWVGNYAGGNRFSLFMRELAYMIQFTTTFVIAAPDSFPRSDGTTTSLNGTITVDGDLTDGRKDFWRDKLNTDLPGFLFTEQTPDGLWTENNAYGDFGDGDYALAADAGTFQPIMGGLLADALGYCWRNTELSTTAREAARKMVLKLAAAQGLRSHNTNVIADEPSVRWRGGHYFLTEGTRANPHAFMYGADAAILNNTPDADMIAQYRQNNALYLITFGWAWEMTGHPWYKTIGDEIANAAFAEIGENTIGSGADGKKAICNAGNHKDYGQCYRSAARYFGHRLLSPASLGTPPSVTMPGNQTLTGGVNQATLTASVACTNTPCTYKWYLEEYPLVLGRQAAQAVFFPDDALTTKLSGMKPGTYKVGMYALDALGLEGHGTVNVTVGDGVFPPVVVAHVTGIPWIGSYISCTTATSVSNIRIRAYSPAGRTLTHSFSGTGPKDASAPTITPSGTTGNTISVTMSGLSPGWWTLKDVVTDSAGSSTPLYYYIAQAASCSSFTQPSTAHNTIPLVTAHPNHILPAGSTSTRLYAVPVDPEGASNFTASATGYFLGYNGSNFVVGALTHSWSQTAGPVTATITTNTAACTPLQPCVTGLTTPGTYTFRYTGTDQQGDAVTTDINVATQAGASVTVATANLQHGQGTDGVFNFQRQIDALAGIDIIAVQERSTTETGWNVPLANAGYTQAVYLENNTTEGDGPAIWVKSATVTVDETHTRALVTGTNPSCGSPNVGWDCTTDVRKSAVAAKVTVQSRQFYVVSVHGCWSRCNNSSGTTLSVQRENQMNDLISWINATLTGGLDVIILGDMNFGPDYAKTTGGLIKDIFTASYTDLWNAGITAGTATAPWGDRNSDTIADMPVSDLGTRTHDTRRIDYIFLKQGATALSLSSIILPDQRATCPHALVAGGTFPSCSPEVVGGPGVSGQQWDIPDDFGVRPSDHNFLKATLNVSAAVTIIRCNWHTLIPCQ